ncbi:MAG: phosphoenolpyruvate kinase [Acidobacteria bacterium]|nr:phosphoenolpyruvate kinase [Acidobacteriota bacterium]
MSRRQPVHVVYGGAHLFNAGTAQKLGRLALAALDRWRPGPEELDCPAKLLERVRDKLTREPVEDYRIDFEDGYGARSGDEEDAHVKSVSQAVRQGAEANTLPPFLGIRIRPLHGETRERGLKTLRQFLQTVSYRLPANFRVTLPKVERPEEVALLAMELRGRAWIEVLVETPPVMGRLRELIDAAGGKLLGVHLGPYDLLASLGIAAPFQRLHHSACTHTRTQMVMAFAGTDVDVVDGPTKILPISERRDEVIAAWQQHRDEILLSLAEGFYQGWDLHPAQLISRYATIYAFYASHAPHMAERLANYEAAAEQAVRMQRQFDDASTVRGLRAFLKRAKDCGAIL